MEQKEHKEKAHKKSNQPREEDVSKAMLVLVAMAALVILFNQFQISNINGLVTTDFVTAVGHSTGTTSLAGGKDLSNIDLTEIKSTGHAIAAVFPIEEIETAEDAMAMIFPTGTPEYGEDLGVSFDDPVGSLATTARMYRSLQAEIQEKDPESFEQFINLASNPYGVSCEYCCGIGPIGASKDGRSRCGCQHNPALLTVALYLSAYTDYNDGEILREVMKWKTLFFPKKMIELTASLAGGDTSSLQDLPGMVGGC